MRLARIWPGPDRLYIIACVTSYCYSALSQTRQTPTTCRNAIHSTLVPSSIRHSCRRDPYSEVSVNAASPAWRLLSEIVCGSSIRDLIISLDQTPGRWDRQSQGMYISYITCQFTEGFRTLLASGDVWRRSAHLSWY